MGKWVCEAQILYMNMWVNGRESVMSIDLGVINLSEHACSKIQNLWIVGIDCIHVCVCACMSW
jgi:hypothetical protein